MALPIVWLFCSCHGVQASPDPPLIERLGHGAGDLGAIDNVAIIIRRQFLEVSSGGDLETLAGSDGGLHQFLIRDRCRAGIAPKVSTIPQGVHRI